MSCRHVIYIYLFLFRVSLTRLHAAYCGGYYRGSNGIISSPNFPSSYAQRLYCLFTIRLPVGKRIHLKWNIFHVPGEMPHCKGDFVRIARCASPWSYLIRYCNDTLPNDVYSYDNCIRVEFRSTSHSPETQKLKRFQIGYETLDTTKSMISHSDCLTKRRYNDKAGNNTMPYYTNIFTPGWPLTYSGLVPRNGCKARMYLSAYTKIKIHFMGIDLYRRDESSHSCAASSNDYLMVRGVSKSRSYTYIYCGYRKPFAVYYNHQFRYVDITLIKRSNDTHNNKGFVLGITMFKDGGRRRQQRLVLPLIPTVIAFAAISTFIFCVIRYLRRRYQTPEGLRAYMQRTHEELHDGNETVHERVEISPGAYTLPPPPPYTGPVCLMGTAYNVNGQFPQHPGTGMFTTVQPISPNSQQTSYPIPYPTSYSAAEANTQPQQYPTAYPVSNANEPSTNVAAANYPSTNPFRNPNDMSANPPSYESVGAHYMPPNPSTGLR